MSRRICLAGVIIVLGAVSMMVSPTRAHAAKVFVKPTGSNSTSCTRSRPCRTFDRAYRKARPGQIVRVAAGTYPSQTLRLDPAKTSSKDVMFEPPRGAKVVVRGEVFVRARHVQFKRMRFAQGWQTGPSARDVTFRSIRARHLFISSGSNIRVIGGEIYPGPNGTDYDSMITTASGSQTPPSNVLIRGVRFHDWIDVSPSQENHIECLQIGSGVNLTIRNSRFWRCGTHDIFIRSWGTINGGYHPLKNIRVENNFLGKTRDGFYSIQFVDDLATSWTSFNVRNNSALQPFRDAVENGTIRFAGNILSAMSSWECQASSRNRWRYNLYESGVRCGSTDRVGRARFVNRSALDLRLRRRSAAVNRGDPQNFARKDIQGQRRPKGARPDAGADERA